MCDIRENWRDLESEKVKEQMLELSMKEEQEYYEYIRINEEKSKLLDLIIKKLDCCNEEDFNKNIRVMLREIERNKAFIR